MEFRIGELSNLTNVKEGTIRFYERCGFLSPVKRLPNGYRMFGEQHVYQVRICKLVFGGFVNKRLRKISMGLIFAAREWDLEAYQKAAADYLRAVGEDIAGTKRAVETVQKRMGGQEEKACISRKDDKGNPFLCNASYSKKQAAAMVGVTPESIRNWERNGLLLQAKAYQKRYYPQDALERMYVIRFLLDNGYSMMAVKSFFAAFDAEGVESAVGMLINPGESGTLIYQADRYLETLLNTRKKAEELCGLLDRMRVLGASDG